MNKVAKNSAIYLAGTIAMAVLGFVNTVLLTRILDTQVYAMYGLLSTFCTSVTMFISFGYDSSYIRFYYSHSYTQKAFMAKCLVVPMLIFALFTVVVLEPSHTLIDYIFEDGLSVAAIVMLLLYTLFFFLHRFSQLTARMEEKALNYSVSNLIAKSGFIIFVFLFFTLRKAVSFEDVLFSFTVSSLAAILINLPVFIKIARKVPETDAGEVRDKALIQYGFPIMVNSFMILVIPLIEKMFIRELAGWEVLSIYTSAAVFQMVGTLISGTIRNIWNPLAYKNYGEPEKLQPIMHNLGYALNILFILGTALCILLRRWLVLLLGSDYRTAYIIAPAVLYAACLDVITIIYGVGIDINKKTVHFIMAPIIQIVVSISICYALIPSMGLVGAGLAALLGIASSNLYRMCFGLYYYGTGQSEAKSAFIVALSMVGVVIAMFSTSLVSDLILSGLMFVIVVLIVNKDIVELVNGLVAFLKVRKE